MRDRRIVVVGGGPAGIAAGLEAALAGAQVTIVEEREDLGGQYYKQLPSGWIAETRSWLDRQYDEGRELIEQLRRLGVEILTGTLVWSLFEDHTLGLTDGTAVWQFPYAKLILATGAGELPVALPGWTLPGVLTGGGAQSLATGQGVLVGRRILLAGVGPFQLRVAAQLIEAGAGIVAILDAANTWTTARSAARVLVYWKQFRQALNYFAVVRRAGVKIFRAHLPTRILGDDRVERVVASRVDDQWRPLPGTEVEFDVDAVCLTFGFVPSVELARLAGCRLDYRPDAGGWFVWHGATQATSVPDVFVAGEAGGVEGAAVALEEGRLAGLEAAWQLGVVEERRYRMRRGEIEQALTRARRPARILRSLTAIRPGLFELITDDTIVCRCEDVRAGEVLAAANRWEPGLRGVKLWTRAGMGMCQSRMCGHIISGLIARTKGIPIDSISLDTPRPPVKPVPLAAMAAPRDGGGAALGAWHERKA
ncbi:MAG: FAD/NAD(P)-binding oxidoreductase [Armatimonadota bacterium]|nr:FAD/NAD(P)-binding oxidoreductase [Armatimonadota bacterium]